MEMSDFATPSTHDNGTVAYPREFQCPECHAVQPDPGRCGRCPGTTRPVGLIVFDDIDHNAERIRAALRKLDAFDPDVNRRERGARLSSSTRLERTCRSDADQDRDRGRHSARRDRVAQTGDRVSAEHKSDCAVHNEPAFPAGPCDCGAARCKCGHPLSEHSEYDDVPCEGTNFRPPGTFVACECPGFEAAEVPTAAPVLPRGVQIRLSEPVSETFDCIRGDIHLYETDQIDYATMMRGLRESVAVLEAKAVKS